MIGMLRLEQLTVSRYNTRTKGTSETLRPWVAKITGRDDEYGYAREFLNNSRDYRNANREGTRGVECWYTLDEDAFYEVCAWGSAHKYRRYFVKVVAGDVVEIEKDEVEAWLGPQLT